MKDCKGEWNAEQLPALSHPLFIIPFLLLATPVLSDLGNEKYEIMDHGLLVQKKIPKNQKGSRKYGPLPLEMWESLDFLPKKIGEIFV